MTAATLPTPLAALKEQLAAVQQSLQHVQQHNEPLRIENTLLRQKLDALARRYCGQQSEQLDAAQLQLLLSGLTAAPETALPQTSLLPAVRPPRPPRAHSQRLRTPDNLEAVKLRPPVAPGRW